MASDGEHYKSFDQVYNRSAKTTDDERPSKKTKRARSQRKKLPFSPSAQHCRNTDMMVQCSECDKWRLVYAKKKLTPGQKKDLTKVIDDIDYTCGMMIDEINLPKGLLVYIKDNDCFDPIETQYYYCGFEPICVYCGDYLTGVENDDAYLPQCNDCNEPPIACRPTNKTCN